MLKISFLVWIAVLLIFSQAAEAYIDPGSGSYLLQMLTAGFFAAMFALKLFWGRIKSFFKPAQGRDHESDQPS